MQFSPPKHMAAFTADWPSHCAVPQPTCRLARKGRVLYDLVAGTGGRGHAQGGWYESHTTRFEPLFELDGVEAFCPSRWRKHTKR